MIQSSNPYVSLEDDACNGACPSVPKCVRHYSRLRNGSDLRRPQCQIVHWVVLFRHQRLMGH